MRNLGSARSGNHHSKSRWLARDKLIDTLDFLSQVSWLSAKDVTFAESSPPSAAGTSVCLGELIDTLDFLSQVSWLSAKDVTFAESSPPSAAGHIRVPGRINRHIGLPVASVVALSKRRDFR